MLSRLAARRRQVDSRFLQFLLNISGTFQVRGLKFTTNAPRWDTTFTFYTLFFFGTTHRLTLKN